MRELTSRRLRFAGCPTGRYPLTWGQLSMVRIATEIGEDPVSTNAQFRGPLAGVTLDAVVAATERVVCAYDSLRARYVDQGTGLWQEVASAGELAVAVYDAGGDDVDDSAVRDIVDAMAARPFTPDELSIRVAVVLAAGVPAALALVVRHLSADGVAVEIVHDAICRLSADPAAPIAPAWQPREIVEFERSPAGREHLRRAVARRRELAHSLASTPAPQRMRSGEPSGVSAAMRHSPASAAAAALLARRYSVSPAMVVLGGFVAVLGRHLGQATCMFQLACANRERPELRNAVANLTQLTTVAVDIDVDDFGEICRRTGLAALRASRCGYLDPAAADDLGPLPPTPYSANLRLVPPTRLRGQVPLSRYTDLGPAQVIDLVKQTVVEEWSFPGTDPPMNDLGFAVWRLDEVGVLSFGADSAAFATGTLTELLSRLESALVGALSASVPVGVPR